MSHKRGRGEEKRREDDSEVMRFNDYDYRSNTNLVLTAQRQQRGAAEPSGEPESLRGKNLHKFGDLARPTAPPSAKSREEIEKDEAKRRAAAEKKSLEAGGKRKKLSDFVKRAKGGLSIDSMADQTYYRPRTEETQAAYENLLSFILPYLGDIPQDVLRGAADEILVVLKDDKLTDPARFSELSNMLKGLKDEDFSKLVHLGKRITDYTAPSELGSRSQGEDQGISVVVQDEEEDGEATDMLDYIRESDEEDEGDETEEGDALAADRAREVTDEDAMQEDEEESDNIDASSIDAYWLQRELSHVFTDPNTNQQKTTEVMDILSEKEDFAAENRLVLLLGHGFFPLIKRLLTNRWKIVYCTRLKRVASDSDRQRIEHEIEADKEHGAPILAELRGEARNKRASRAATNGERTARVSGSSADRQAHMVDFENLIFDQGSHFMANKSVELPSGSLRTSFKGYEEIVVPAPKAPEMSRTERLIDMKELPEWARAAFPGVKQLNRIQSRVYEAAFKSPENMLVCAPTGAGKTNTAVLCIMHEVGMHIDAERSTVGQPVLLDKDFKIVYIAPMKALVQEVVGNLRERLSKFGINVHELTGDVNMTKQQIDETQIIVSTPEKWDIVTRKAGERSYVSLVRLIIIDEIHLLHDERGPVLESIVARTIRQQEVTQENVRIVGLSATLPNYEDVATFLRVRPDNLFHFDNAYRPVPLQQTYIGVTERKPLKRHQVMNDITYEKIMDFAGKNQVLVFVHSRRETASTAKALRDNAVERSEVSKFIREGSASREILLTEAAETKNKDLKELLPHGFAIHHAGMTRADRTLVEDLFADGHVQVLVSTATLAWGVNLPAHAVIIKGTQVYNPEKGRWMELSPLDVMQMFGRAGRPQYDKRGEGIIVTTHQELQFYLSLLNQQLPIESQFIKDLADNLNAEIVLGTVQNVKDAVDWLGYTYLYVRMIKNPSLYGIDADVFDSDTLLEQRRKDLVHTAAAILDKHGLIKYDRKVGIFQSTDLGRVASHYYVSYKSIATFNDHLKPSMGDIELFKLFALSEEFQFISVRQEEKLEMQKMLERVPIPIKESLDEPAAKVNVLLQAYISRLKLEGYALVSDMVFVTQNANRIVRALFEICLKRGWAQLTRRILNLAKMIEHRMWLSHSPLRQFPKIPQELVVLLERKEVPWDALYSFTPGEIADLVRVPKLGNTLYRFIHQFPRLVARAHVQPITRSMLRVELVLQPDFEYDEKIHGPAQTFWVLVEDVDGEVILHSEPFVLKSKYSQEEHTVSFTVPIFDPLPPQYFIRVVSDHWIGSEFLLPVSFRQLLLPAKYPPPTELLDLTPVKISAIRNQEYQNALFSQYQQFNAIQTQVFNALYNQNDNVFVAAPTGAGKTVCAELALLRMFNLTNGEGKAVCILPMDKMVELRMRDWRVKFAERLGKVVSVLTGDINTDQKLLERSHIVISTPQNFDVISRRWKVKKIVQRINLFICDELHHVGGTGGPAYEVIVSRMRYISAAQESDKKTRIVGLSTSVANAKDLGEWIGASAKKSTLFAFHPSTRPVPVEIHINGFTQQTFGARFQAMARPIYLAIRNRSEGKPVIVFVPTRKQARFLAAELATAIAAEHGEEARRRYIEIDQEDLQPFLQRIGNRALQQSLEFGVALYHDGMSQEERRVVEQLYKSGATKILIATHDECWGMDMDAHTVIIAGAQYYDGREHRYIDFSMSQMVQMLGRNCRPLVDDNSKCFLFCHAPKKDFYKKFLNEPFPVESHLDHYLPDHMNAEIVTKTVSTKQNAVDYLTWTFLYRRLLQNPNYYNLHGTTPNHLSDYLSELVENTLKELETAKCIAMEEGETADEASGITALNLGIIAAHYYIQYTTVELFSSSLTEKTKIRGLIEILAAASEFDDLPVRQGEDEVLRRLAAHVPEKITNPKYNDPHTKANILLQTHFSRQKLNADLEKDKAKVLSQSLKLIQAMVDVISSNEHMKWLKPTLAAMELSQMIVQAMWKQDSFLMQVPHFDQDLCQRCAQAGIETVFDLIEMDDEDRNKLLQFSAQQMVDVAKCLNRYPNVDSRAVVEDDDAIVAGEPVTVTVSFELEEEDFQTSIHAPFYPDADNKWENWWVVVGDTEKNKLVAVKLVNNLVKPTKTKLQFLAPDASGNYNLTLFVMCDSASGVDTFHELRLNVLPAENGPEDDGDMVDE